MQKPKRLTSPKQALAQKCCLLTYSIQKIRSNLFFQPETQLTVLSAILGTTQDVTTPGTGHTQRFALGDDDHHHHHEHEIHENGNTGYSDHNDGHDDEKHVMDSSLCMENVRCIDAQ